MPIEIADVFSGDAFTALTLTQRINNVPFTPSLLGSIGLYQGDGVRTTDIAVEEMNGNLKLVPTSPRGAPPAQIDHPKAKMRKVTAAHIALEAQVNADEVQNALTYGATINQPQMQTAADLLDDRMEGPFGLRARLELTHEYHRLGGIQGIVLDADGTTVLYNWFDFFGISALADHNTDFGALTADGAAFEVECATLKRDAVRELEGLPVTTARLVVFCGDNYYDKVYSNKEVKAGRRNRDTGRDSDVFGDNKAFSSIDYGGITWVNYRGMKDGTVGIDTEEARLVVLGVPGLFQMLFSPPDIMGMTNMPGLPIHAFMPPSRQTERQAVIEAQSNPLTLCVRPRSLRLLTHS